MIRFVLALSLLVAACSAAPVERDASGDDRARVALLTSLPLVFAETFSLEHTGSPALAAIEQEWAVETISIADAASLADHELLLMAHPPVQTAEALVELDQWVRDGGRLLLLADPKLAWPSRLALGDRRRPPPWFSDTGLLGHWDLVLAGPEPDGPTTLSVPGGSVLTVAPGQLRATGRNCEIEAGGFIARCGIGAGAVIVIADADFLNVEALGALDQPSDYNLPFLIAQLKALAAG